MSQSTDLSSARAAATPSRPGFVGALRGVCLLTWKSQLGWRRLPGQLGALLVLPALICMTVVAPATWARRHVSLGDTGQAANSFSRRLQRAGIPLPPKSREDLRRILAEETERDEAAWREQAGESPEVRLRRLKDLVADWDRQILTRAKNVLDDRQYAEFQSFQQRNRDNTLRRLTAVSVPWSRTEPFYHWLIDFYFFIILPLTCVRACGPLIRDEAQADTLGFLITRPVSRAQLIVVKYISQVAWLQFVLLLEALLLFAAGAARAVPSLGVLLPLVLGVQILVIPAWSALGLLLGQLTARYMATALIYGAIVEMGIGRIPTNINTLSIMRHLKILLAHNPALQAIYDWPTGGTATAICALLVAPVLFLSMAALLFSMIEYHHAAEMQK